MPSTIDQEDPSMDSVRHLLKIAGPADHIPQTSVGDDGNSTISYSIDDDDSSETNSSLTKLITNGNLRSLKSKTKAKAKALLHLSHSEALMVEADCEDGGALHHIQNDPAFHPTRVTEDAGKQLGDQRSPVDRAVDRMKNLGTTIAHPRTAIQSKAKRTTAMGLSASVPPQLSHGADQHLVELHDDLLTAEGRSSTMVASDEEEEEGEVETDVKCRRDKITKMEEYRASVRVAWTTKHIDRVRVVPQAMVEKPKRTAFVERDEKGEVVRIRWGDLLGHFLLYYTQNVGRQYIDDFDEPPFDIDRLRDHVERIVIASAPWQTWLMEVRKVYRWEDPRRTSLWLIVYVVCWYCQFFLGFVYGYIIYLVLANRYFPSSIKPLRASNERAMEQKGTAFQLEELMYKYGRDGWIEPLVEAVGPYAQLEAGDLADLLEAFTNFYAWKSPLKTTQTLFVFATCLLVSLLTDMVFSMRIFWFLVGAAFFLCWPISSRYPRYRHLVSPIKWVFWDVPTDAECAFAYLREKAMVGKEGVREKGGVREREVERVEEERVGLAPTTGHLQRSKIGEPGIPDSVNEDGARDTSDDDEEWHTPPSPPCPLPSAPLLAFPAHHASHPGRLLLTPTAIRFVQTSPLHHHPRAELFTLPYAHLREMRKIDGTMSRLAKVSGALPKKVKESGEDLWFLREGGEEVLVESVADRDEAFNAVLGFSGLWWRRGESGGGRGGGGEGKGMWGRWGTMGVG